MIGAECSHLENALLLLLVVSIVRLANASLWLLVFFLIYLVLASSVCVSGDDVRAYIF